MAYSKSPKNKFAPSTVVSMASMTSNRPMSYGQVYENLNYEMSMHKISDTDRKWMASRKNFINSNKRAFEELQIKVGNLIEAGKIPPNFANNLDKICTDNEFNSIKSEVNRMESSRAIDRTGHFRTIGATVVTGTPKKSDDVATADKPTTPDETATDNTDTQENTADAATVKSVVESNSENDTGSPLDQTDWSVFDQSTVLTKKAKTPRKKAKNQEKLIQKNKNLEEKKKNLMKLKSV